MRLVPELMSSEDSDGVCHPPSYRSATLTSLFENTVDVVKLQTGNDIVKRRGRIHHKDIPEFLIGHPSVVL